MYNIFLIQQNLLTIIITLQQFLEGNSIDYIFGLISIRYGEKQKKLAN